MKTLKTSVEFAGGKNDIEWLGSQFKSVFGKTTFSPASAEGIESRTLTRSMTDVEIFAEFKPAAVTLGDVLAYLKGADRDGWFIFYVNDRKGVLWAVHAVWRAGLGGWFVEAYSVESPSGWCVGFQVLSRRFSDSLPQTLSPLDTLPLELEINGFKYRRV